MNIDAQGKTARKDRPLTRANIQSLLQMLGNSNKLVLKNQNMVGIDLKNLVLKGADLTGADLTGADLTRANLIGATLLLVNLTGAILDETDLTGARLIGAIFTGATLLLVNLTGADLTGARLSKVDLEGDNLTGARLTQADLTGARLTGANFTQADLTGANLTGADLRLADLTGAILTGAILDENNLTQADHPKASKEEAVVAEADLTQSIPSKVAQPAVVNPKSSSTFRTYIIEEPLTPYNLATIISSLTELSTMYWLIVKGRFSDLIEYSQTHNVQFSQEAKLTVTKITYNSPFCMDLKVDLSAPSVADGIIATIDGITQRGAKLAKAELENQAKAQEIKFAQQKAEQEEQAAVLELERKAIENEKERLVLLGQQLDLQKKGIEYALEVAKKTVDLLQPNADDATKGMIIQTILPNILQLQNGNGLTLALPSPKSPMETRAISVNA